MIVIVDISLIIKGEKMLKAQIIDMMEKIFMMITSRIIQIFA